MTLHSNSSVRYRPRNQLLTKLWCHQQYRFVVRFGLRAVNELVLKDFKESPCHVEVLSLKTQAHC
jgi:hypothetical protein